ncbi:MAG: MFS transporter [Chloroflexi bacterium]|nr:MFS transporter [Chloroflexota bacterium]
MAISQSRRTSIFYGWLIVAIAFCGSFITAGTGGYIFGQFIKPMSLAFGWTVGFVSSMNFTRSMTGIALSPIIGRLTDRFGSRPIMLTGSLVAGGAFIFAALTEQPALFYFLYAVILSVGYGMLGGVPAQAVVTRWFRRRRGMAIAMSTMGISAGGIVMVPTAQYLIDNVGWRFALGAIGIGILLVMLPPVFFFMRDYPEQMGLHPDGEDPPPPGSASPAVTAASALEERLWTTREVMRAPAFWKQALGYMFAFGMLQVTLVYQFPVLTERGFSNAVAAAIVSAYAVCAALSRFLWGYLSDKLPVQRIATVSIWIAAGGIWILILSNEPALAWVYAVVGGIGISGLAALQSVVTAQSFGRRSYGTVAGLLNPMNQLASALAVPFTGFLHDATGSYNLGIAVIVILAMASSLSLLTLRRAGE